MVVNNFSFNPTDVLSSKTNLVVNAMNIFRSTFLNYYNREDCYTDKDTNSTASNKSTKFTCERSDEHHEADACSRVSTGRSADHGLQPSTFI